MSKEVNEERTPRTVEDVKEMLTKHSNGEIQRTIQNCITILQNDHVLADAIRLNLLSERIDIVKPVGWSRSGKTLNDTDMKYILRRMEKYGISSEKKIESAIRIVANENRYHPIRDYLNSLKWDGTERIAHVLHHFLGAAEDEYTCEAIKIFFAAAVRHRAAPPVLRRNGHGSDGARLRGRDEPHRRAHLSARRPDEENPLEVIRPQAGSARPPL